MLRLVAPERKSRSLACGSGFQGSAVTPVERGCPSSKYDSSASLGMTTRGVALLGLVGRESKCRSLACGSGFQRNALTPDERGCPTSKYDSSASLGMTTRGVVALLRLVARESKCRSLACGSGFQRNAVTLVERGCPTSKYDSSASLGMTTRGVVALLRLVAGEESTIPRLRSDDNTRALLPC